jgi:hypothetical protein
MPENLKKLTTPQLWTEMKAVVGRTADNLKRMAEIWVELEARGEDLSGYRNPMLSFLPEVASGKLLPEILLRFGSNVSIISTLSSLVVEDQRKLVSHPDTRVTVLQHDGKTRKASITDLRIPELRQVFGDGRIRTVKEQKQHLAPAPRKSETRVSRERPVNDDVWDVSASMTDAQRERITILADESGMSQAEYVVDALVRHKIIPGRSARRPSSPSASFHAAAL